MSSKGKHWKRFDILGEKNPAKRKSVREKISKKLKGRKAIWNTKLKGQIRPKTSKSLIRAYSEGRIKPNRFTNGGYRKDLEMYFRSNWEANYARILNYQEVIWEYEPQVFVVTIEGKDCTYRPDFYLPLRDKYIEVKGYWIGKAKQKFEAFKEKYNIDLVNLEKYKKLALEYQDKINWEGTKYA